MAQLDTSSARARLLLRFRQRPTLIVVVVVCAALVLVAAGLGIASAGSEGVRYLAAEEADAGSGEASEGGEGSSGASAVDRADETSGAGTGEKAAARIYVDVGGAVNQPGLIALEEGSRVNDAVREAGGFAEGADTSSINLAELLSDGEKLYVPKEGEGQQVPNVAAAAQGASGLVNINTADVAALDELPGVGPSTAQAIVDDREQNGAFASVEDIMRVSGIGEKKFEKLKGSICV